MNPALKGDNVQHKGLPSGASRTSGWGVLGPLSGAGSWADSPIPAHILLCILAEKGLEYTGAWVAQASHSSWGPALLGRDSPPSPGVKEHKHTSQVAFSEVPASGS